MGKPLSDHRDHNNPMSMRGEIFRLRALLMDETREKLQALELVDTLTSRIAELERRLDRANRPIEE